MGGTTQIILVDKPEWKRPHGKTRNRQGDHMRMVLTIIG